MTLTPAENVRSDGQPLTDGDHYRRIKATLDDLYDRVNEAVEAGLNVTVHATLEASEERWAELAVCIDRDIGEESP